MTAPDRIASLKAELTRKYSPIDALKYLLTEYNGANSGKPNPLHDAICRIQCNEHGIVDNSQEVISLIEPLAEDHHSQRSILGQELLLSTIEIVASISSFSADDALTNVLEYVTPNPTSYAFFKALVNRNFEVIDNAQSSSERKEHRLEYLGQSLEDDFTFSNIDFCNVDFSNCSLFRGTFHNVVFNNCTFDNARFVNCELDNVSFQNCRGDNFEILTPRSNITRFNNCSISFRTTVIDGRLLKEIRNSTLRRLQLYGYSSDLGLTIADSQLEGTISNVILSAKASDDQFSGADVRDCEIDGFQLLGIPVERSQFAERYYRVIVPDWNNQVQQLVDVCEQKRDSDDRFEATTASILLQIIDEDAAHSSAGTRGNRFASELLYTTRQRSNNRYLEFYHDAGIRFGENPVESQ